MLSSLLESLFQQEILAFIFCCSSSGSKAAVNIAAHILGEYCFAS